VLSPQFAYEGLTAFFLEAAFLGGAVGRSLVPRWAHFVAAVMVAFGTLLSSFWILSAIAGCRRPPATNWWTAASIPGTFAIVF